MKVHARLHPGRITDLAQPVEVHLHQPRQASDVTIKLWELDAFLGADGQPRREGSPDDLLATFVGAIEPAPPGRRGPDWRRFLVRSVEFAPAPPDALRWKLRFPGSDVVYDLPLVSEAAEVEGTDYELGLSIEIGGAERFRTKAPTLLTPASVVPRLRELVIVGYDDDGAPILDGAIEVEPRAARVVIGRPPADFDDDRDDPAVLDAVLERPQVFEVTAGALRRPTAGGAVDPSGVVLAAGRRLRAFVGPPDAKPIAAMALPVGDDGAITVYRVDTNHRRTFYAGGGAPPTSRRAGERDLPQAPALLTGRTTAPRRALFGRRS